MGSLIAEQGPSDNETESSAKTPQTLRYSVLGPPRVHRGEAEVPLGRPQEQALLCALLLRGGRTATAEELVDAIWDEEPPAHVIASLRTHAFRLRQKLGPGVLTSRAGGYALMPAPGTLDTQLCETFAQQARHARATGDLRQARSALRSALRLWDGEPLAGVPGPHARIQRRRLLERHHTLHENRLEVELELGLHAQAVAELTALAAEQPLRESVRGLLMLALYRGGRQADALRVYDDTRQLLTGELGIDPCRQLATLHQQILRGDQKIGFFHHQGSGERRPTPID